MKFQALLIEGLPHGLKYTRNDIECVSKTFEKMKIPTETITVNNAETVRSMLVEKCDGAHSNENLIIYYTGHGVIKGKKLNFKFCNTNSVYSDLLSLNAIVEIFSNSVYSKIILLLDCCNAEAAQTTLAQEDIERFHLIYSSRTLEKSWELDTFQLSAFTKFLCDAVDNFLDHSQSDTKITLANLDSSVRRMVKEYNETTDMDIPLPGSLGSKADQIVLFTSYADSDTAVTAKIKEYHDNFLSCIENCTKRCSKGYAWCNTLCMHDVKLNKYAIPTVNTSLGKQMKLNDFFRSWVKSNENYLALLGNVGVGKTSACFYLVSLVAKAEIELTLVPIFIPLHEWDDLSKKCDVMRAAIYFSNSFFTEPEIQQLIKSKRLLLLLDGFDEISAESTLSSILSNFQKLIPFLRLGCKTLLTCRTHYFADESQINDVLQRRIPGTDLASILLNDDQYSFEIADLQEFSEDEIIEVIQLSMLPEDANQIWNDIKSIYDLRDLAKRAIILKMILKTLPELKEKSEERKVTTTTLYSLYTRKLLLRELQGRDYKMDLSDIEKFIEYIASLMWKNQTLSINTEKFKDEISYFYHHQEHSVVYNLDQYIYSGRVSSFFVRDRNDNYLFSHKSFFEYYLARYCVNSLDNDSCWSRKWFDKEISAFITDIIRKENKRHTIFYLVELANQTSNPIVIWNVLHILSLLDINDVSLFLTKDVTDKMLKKAGRESNCVIIRQYCRIIAKFIDRPIAEQYIDKIIDIVKRDDSQNQENNETYFNYYGGKDAACQAFIKHLQVTEPKYDAKLHIYLLGNIAGANYLPKFKAAVNNWPSDKYEQKRVFIEEAIKLITSRGEINVAPLC